MQRFRVWPFGEERQSTCLASSRRLSRVSQMIIPPPGDELPRPPHQTAFARPSLVRVRLRVLAQACFGCASGRFPGFWLLACSRSSGCSARWPRCATSGVNRSRWMIPSSRLFSAMPFQLRRSTMRCAPRLSGSDACRKEVVRSRMHDWLHREAPAGFAVLRTYM